MADASAQRASPAWYDYFTRDDSASITWLLGSVVLLLLGVTEGFILAIEFVFPDFAAGVPELVFGRLRQGHTNTVMFAFLSTAMIGIWYYLVPRLSGRRLWSEVMGNIAAISWEITTLVGVILLLLGHSQGREYAEMVYGVDVMVIFVCILNLVNLYMTVSKRTEPKLFVSLWYILGTLIWFPLLYFIGNVMWVMPKGSLIGIDDTIFNWFYGHNVLGLWFTTGYLAVIYYIVSRESNMPLYSQVLSLISFWGNALFYTGVGGHHLEWAPIPYWLKSIAVAESIGMILVIVAFMANIWLTVRGNWNKVFTSIPLRFTFIGFLAYILVSYQGSHLALRNMNLLFHFTQYVPAHSHLSLLFFSASVAIGGTYYIIPRVFHVRLYSTTLANVGFVLYLIGFLFFFTGFVLVGAVQGGNWVHGGIPVWTTLPTIRPYLALRAASGAVLWSSFWVFAYDIFATIIVRKPIHVPEAGADLPLKGGPAQNPSAAPAD